MLLTAVDFDMSTHSDICSIWHEAKRQRHGVLLSAVQTKCGRGAYDPSKSILCSAVDVSAVPNVIFYDSLFLFHYIEIFRFMLRFSQFCMK